MLDKTEIKTLQEIESKYYMKPILESIMQDLENSRLDAKTVFNHLYRYLLDSKEAVENC